MKNLPGSSNAEPLEGEHGKIHVNGATSNVDTVIMKESLMVENGPDNKERVRGTNLLHISTGKS